MKYNNTENVELTKKQILGVIRKNESKLRRLGVKKIGLFGSYVRNEQNDKSDLDILVEFENGKKSFRNFIDLVFYLEDLFNRKVELVTTEALSPYIGHYILEEVEYATF